MISVSIDSHLVKFGIRKNLRNVNLPFGLCLRWSSMNWQGQRAETQWRGGTDKPITPLSRSCESITRSSLRRTKWRAHRDAYLSNSNSARSCQHTPSSFSRTQVWCEIIMCGFSSTFSIFCQESLKFYLFEVEAQACKFNFNVIYFYHIYNCRELTIKKSISFNNIVCK